MRILIAEDEKVSRLRLEKILSEWGFEVEAYPDGQSAWERLCMNDPPRLCIIDWLMPAMPPMKGPELCRRVRERFPEESFYLIILSARQGVDNLIEGLNANAEDYVTKPFGGRELRSRIGVGAPIIGLERILVNKVHQLESALEDVKQLRGFSRSARTEIKSETMKTIGNRLKVISPGGPMWNSATPSARNAMRNMSSRC